MIAVLISLMFVLPFVVFLLLVTAPTGYEDDDGFHYGEPKEHWSDCAIYNEPAMEAGPCDCGGYDGSTQEHLAMSRPEMYISRNLSDFVKKPGEDE